MSSCQLLIRQFLRCDLNHVLLAECLQLFRNVLSQTALLPGVVLFDVMVARGLAVEPLQADGAPQVVLWVVGLHVFLDSIFDFEADLADAALPVGHAVVGLGPVVLQPRRAHEATWARVAHERHQTIVVVVVVLSEKGVVFPKCKLFPRA